MPDRPFLVLTPDLTIVDASDAYLRATLVWREEIKGCRMFDVFPDNPADAGADGVTNLRASLHAVLKTGTAQAMPLQRYDVRDRVCGSGAWTEKYWSPANSPVFGSGSQEVTHVIHHVEDMTAAVLLQRWLDEARTILGEQRMTLEAALQQVSARDAELNDAQSHLADLLHTGALQGAVVDALRRRLGAPDDRRYQCAGDTASVSGIYTAHHQQRCAGAVPQVYIGQGRSFPGCPKCGEGVLYRLLHRI
jgi:hypothetical protein